MIRKLIYLIISVLFQFFNSARFSGREYNNLSLRNNAGRRERVQPRYPVMPPHRIALLLGIFPRRKTTEHSGNSSRSAKSDSSSSLIGIATSSTSPQIGLSRTPVDATSSNHRKWYWLSRTAASPASSKSEWVENTAISSSGGNLAADSAGEAAAETAEELDFGRGTEWLWSLA